MAAPSPAPTDIWDAAPVNEGLSGVVVELEPRLEVTVGTPVAVTAVGPATRVLFKAAVGYGITLALAFELCTALELHDEGVGVAMAWG